MSPGAWERETPSVLLAILTREIVAMKWAMGFRNLVLPSMSGVVLKTGAPFDVARNAACDDALENGFQWCFRPDTLVETDMGAKPIVDIQIGDRVRTHLGRFKRVTEVFAKQLRQGAPYLWIRTDSSTIKVTDGHPFWVRRSGVAKFIRANALRETDLLLYPVDTRERQDTLRFGIRMNTSGPDGNGLRGSKKLGASIERLTVDRDLARFLGLYLAEGCGGHDSIRFTFGNHEKELHDFVVSMCKRVFGRAPSIHRRWATTIKLNIRSLSPLFTEWFGNNALVKRIPEFVFDWSIINKLSFISGFIQGDGCHSQPMWNYRTSSRRLAIDMQRLASTVGMTSKSVRVKGSETEYKGATIRSKQSWAGWFSTKSVSKAKDILGGKNNDGYVAIRIRSIDRHYMASSLLDSNVYNLEVEDDHSYIADSAAVHNCMFLDDDVIPPGDVFFRLSRHNADIVSGLYYRRQEPICPVAMTIGADGKSEWVRSWNPPDSTIEVDLVGAGCLLIHRRVLERVQRPWFDWEIGKEDPGRGRNAMSEDFAFCMRAKAAGFKVYLDTSVRCEHVGLGQSNASDGSFKPSALP